MILFDCQIDDDIGTAEVWKRVVWQARVRNDPTFTTAPCVAAPAIFESGVPLWVGRPHTFTDGDAAGDFVELIDFLEVNPLTGSPWDSGDFGLIEFGILLLEGRADMSFLGVTLEELPLRAEDSPGALLCSLTTTGLANVTRAVGDDLVWKIDRYTVGRGGFQQDNPAVTLPLEPADDTLMDPVYTGVVDKASFDGTSAYYWVAIPPDVLSEPLGEIMLEARIISSNGGDTPGDYFPMAVCHIPAQFHSYRDMRVVLLEIQYTV